MTDCISLIQLVGFLNQTIYKLELAVETPRTRALSLPVPLCFSGIENKCLTLSQAFLCPVCMKTCHL